MPPPTEGPWVKYQQPSGGPWSQYGGPSSTDTDPPDYSKVPTSYGPLVPMLDLFGDKFKSLPPDEQKGIALGGLRGALEHRLSPQGLGESAASLGSGLIFQGLSEPIANAVNKYAGPAADKMVAGFTRLLRGPGGYGEIEAPGFLKPVTRELEATVPRNMPPTARDEMYTDLGERRLARGAEQAKMDAANEQRLKEIEDARQKELANAERLKEQDAQARERRGRLAPELGTPENTGLMSRIPSRMPKTEPELGSPENPGLMSPIPTTMEGRMGSSVPTGAYSKVPTTMPRVPEAEPELGTPENPGLYARIPSRMPRAQQSVVLAPEQGFSGSEGRAATWTNEDVRRIALDPNASMADRRAAVSQMVRRGMQLPENFRYLAGSPDYGRGVYNPREVTKFTPEGTPIRQTGKIRLGNRMLIEPGEK